MGPSASALPALRSAGEVGRLGGDCAGLYAAGCPAAEWRFAGAAAAFPASAESSRRRTERMLRWAFFREDR